MRNLAVVSVVVSLLTACGGDGGSESSGPFGVVANVFGARPEPIDSVYVAGDYGAPAAAGSPSSYGDSVSALQVQGHLEGQLRDIPLSGDTTDNYGSHEAWPDGGGYLSASVALGTPQGAGMMILSVSGGLEHPAFDEGRWSSEREREFQGEPGYAGTQGVYVSSCAGPALGNYPYEQAAVSYDMTLETDPLDPSTVVIVVGASFYVNEQSAQTSDLSATVRFVRPE